MWVEFSPDVPVSGSETTTAATTAAAVAATIPTTAAATTAKIATVINTEAAALKLVSQLTGKTNLEFLREEDFIFNKDGTLSIDVNTPD